MIYLSRLIPEENALDVHLKALCMADSIQLIETELCNYLSSERNPLYWPEADRRDSWGWGIASTRTGISNVNSLLAKLVISQRHSAKACIAGILVAIHV